MFRKRVCLYGFDIYRLRRSEKNVVEKLLMTPCHLAVMCYIHISDCYSNKLSSYTVQRCKFLREPLIGMILPCVYLRKYIKKFGSCFGCFFVAVADMLKLQGVTHFSCVMYIRIHSAVC